MGSGRDKRKKAKGKAPGQGEQKTTKKTEKNENKAERRAAKILEASLTHDDHARLPIHIAVGRCMVQACERLITAIIRSYGPSSTRAVQGGEDDLDALLKQFKLQDKIAKAIEVQHNVDQPSARLFASFTPIPGAVSSHMPIWCSQSACTV